MNFLPIVLRIIHNHIIAELLLHRERLREHMTAVTRSLAKERAKVGDLSATHQVDVSYDLHSLMINCHLGLVTIRY